MAEKISGRAIVEKLKEQLRGSQRKTASAPSGGKVNRRRTRTAAKTARGSKSRRRNRSAGYRRAANSEQVVELRSRIDEAVSAGEQIRAEIEAKIDRRLREAGKLKVAEAE